MGKFIAVNTLNSVNSYQGTVISYELFVLNSSAS